MKKLRELKKQKEKKDNLDTAKKIGVGVAIGLVAGATAGILSAPKSGKETREDICKKGKDVQEGFSQAVEKGKEKVDEIKDKVSSKKVY